MARPRACGGRRNLRSEVPVQVQWIPEPGGNLWTAVIEGGVNVLVDGMSNFGSIDLSAECVVFWTVGQAMPDLSGQTRQKEDTPLEIYMEGTSSSAKGTA